MTSSCLRGDLGKVKQFVVNGVFDAHSDWEFRKHLLNFYREDVVLQVFNASEGHKLASNTGSEPVGTTAELSPINAAPDANHDASPDGGVVPNSRQSTGIEGSSVTPEKHLMSIVCRRNLLRRDTRRWLG